MNHVSLDLETLDTIPGGAILSIGAVEFDPITGTLGRRFHEIINFDSCMQHGFTWSSDTKAWWGRQSPEARVTLERSMGNHGQPVKEVLHAFGVWLEGLNHDGTSHTCIWGNGAAFDNAFLAVAYVRVGRKLPWSFWNDRCLRTLKGLFAKDSIELPTRTGTYHNALDDAVYQARCAIVYLQALQNLSKLTAPPSTLDSRWPAAELVKASRGLPRVDLTRPQGTYDQIAPAAPDSNRWPMCPKCQLPFIPTSTGLVCENGHSGD